MNITPAVIEDLKKNEKPFGLMDTVMQAAARSIGKIEGNWLHYSGIREKWAVPIHDNSEFVERTAYRLRPDYEPESEIDERPIMPAEAGLVCCSAILGTENLLISECQNDPDFIGFKFEDGYSYVSPIRYISKNHVHTTPMTNASDLFNGAYTVLHATHVLFRK